MNSEVLNKFLTEMAGLLKSAKDFTLEQLPQVAKEVLTIHVIQYSLWALVGLLFLAAGVYLIRRGVYLHKNYTELNRKAGYRQYDSDTPFVVYVMGILSTILGVALFLCNLYNALEVYFAPRMHLIEYFLHLTRSNCK